jgi:hypothetical protein
MFRKRFEECMYLLGDRKGIIALFHRWDHLSDALALKMLFNSSPVYMVCGACLTLVLMSAYCIRVSESPVNKFHSEQFWNQLWLIICTITTVGYGDNVPSTHFGRFVCVVAMMLGTIIVSMMTAAATGFLHLTRSQKVISHTSDTAIGRRRVTMEIARYLQFVFRVNHGYIKEDWRHQNELRRGFWRALHAFRATEKQEWTSESLSGQAKPAEEMQRQVAQEPDVVGQHFDDPDATGLRLLKMKQRYRTKSFVGADHIVVSSEQQEAAVHSGGGQGFTAGADAERAGDLTLQTMMAVLKDVLEEHTQQLTSKLDESTRAVQAVERELETLRDEVRNLSSIVSGHQTEHSQDEVLGPGEKTQASLFDQTIDKAIYSSQRSLRSSCKSSSARERAARSRRSSSQERRAERKVAAPARHESPLRGDARGGWEDFEDMRTEFPPRLSARESRNPGNVVRYSSREREGSEQEREGRPSSGKYAAGRALIQVWLCLCLCLYASCVLVWSWAVGAETSFLVFFRSLPGSFVRWKK